MHAPAIDLLAIKGSRKIAIAVKTTGPRISLSCQGSLVDADVLKTYWHWLKCPKCDGSLRVDKGYVVISWTGKRHCDQYRKRVCHEVGEVRKRVGLTSAVTFALSVRQYLIKRSECP